MKEDKKAESKHEVIQTGTDRWECKCGFTAWHSNAVKHHVYLETKAEPSHFNSKEGEAYVKEFFHEVTVEDKRKMIPLSAVEALITKWEDQRGNSVDEFTVLGYAIDDLKELTKEKDREK